MILTLMILMIIPTILIDITITLTILTFMLILLIIIIFIIVSITIALYLALALTLSPPVFQGSLPLTFESALSLSLSYIFQSSLSLTSFETLIFQSSLSSQSSLAFCLSAPSSKFSLSLQSSLAEVARSALLRMANAAAQTTSGELSKVAQSHTWRTSHQLPAVW